MARLPDLPGRKALRVRLPKVIYVGPHDYDVQTKKHLDLLGETDNSNTAITLKARQSRTSMQDTILHEALHAIVFNSGLFKTLDLDNETEEKLVVTISPWILQLIKDNPELVQFLQGGEAEAA